jgi:hypothetical protein
VYRNRYNFELDKEFNSPNVIGVVKNNILHNAGHIIRGAEDLPQRAMPEFRRNQERPKIRWADGENNDSRTFKARVWTKHAQDKVQ